MYYNIFPLTLRYIPILRHRVLFLLSFGLFAFVSRESGTLSQLFTIIRSIISGLHSYRPQPTVREE